MAWDRGVAVSVVPGVGSAWFIYSGISDSGGLVYI